MSSAVARVVEMSSQELAYARQELPGSRPQAMLHNYLVQRIEEVRSQLETAAPENVPGMQVAIREARALLGVLHEHDNEAVKRIYE